MKKYTIAQNEKELHTNFKVMAKKYFKAIKRTKLEILKQIAILFWFALRLKGLFEIHDKKLCAQYFDEVDLYYLNRNLTKRDLQITKSYQDKKHEHRYSVTLPICLSIIASLIQGIIFADYFSSIWAQFKNMGDQLSENALTYKDLLYYIADYSPGLLVYFPLVIVIVIFLLIWLTYQSINIAGYFLDGLNVNKAIAEQYHIDRINELISCDMYFVLIETLKLLSREFKQIIYQLVHNSVIVNKSISVEDFEKEIEEKFMNNPHINALINNDMLKMWDKKIIIKSIIFRAILENNGNKLSKWEFSKGMLSIK